MWSSCHHHLLTIRLHHHARLRGSLHHHLWVLLLRRWEHARLLRLHRSYVLLLRDSRHLLHHLLPNIVSHLLSWLLWLMYHVLLPIHGWLHNLGRACWLLARWVDRSNLVWCHGRLCWQQWSLCIVLETLAQINCISPLWLGQCLVPNRVEVNARCWSLRHHCHRLNTS